MAYGNGRKSDLKVALGGLGAGIVWILIVGAIAFWLANRGSEGAEAVGFNQAQVGVSIQG